MFRQGAKRKGLSLRYGPADRRIDGWTDHVIRQIRDWSVWSVRSFVLPFPASDKRKKNHYFVRHFVPPCVCLSLPVCLSAVFLSSCMSRFCLTVFPSVSLALSLSCSLYYFITLFLFYISIVLYFILLYFIIIYIIYIYYIFIDEPINFKDNLRTIEARFWKKLRTTEARFDFTGPYKKKKVY